jgi:hypothetical protein
MKTYVASQTPGCLVGQLRLQRHLAPGNSLNYLDAVIDEVNFRPPRMPHFLGLSEEQTEHVFGSKSQSMKGFYVRSIGRRRNAAAMGFLHRFDNRARYE